MERKAETKAVKKELEKHGINARVGHGRGTAWGWLEINVGEGQQFGEHILDEHQTHRNCPRCKAAHIISGFATKIAQAITGRNGEYDGNISCLTQHHWTDKRGRIPIVHDLLKLRQAIPELADLN